MKKIDRHRLDVDPDFFGMPIAFLLPLMSTFLSWFACEAYWLLVSH